MKIITEENKAMLVELFRDFQPEILLVLLFGSYDTEYFRSDSDIDFAVLFGANAGLMDEMKLLSRISLLLEYERADLVNLNQAPVTIQFNALGGKIIYEKDKTITSDFLERVLRMYGDYKPVLDRFDKELLEREIPSSEY